MDNRSNNIFVAFALWAGAWALIRFFDYWVYELQIAVAGFSQDFSPISVDHLPELAGFMVVLIAARVWKTSIFSLIFLFIAFELVWSFLAFAAWNNYFIMCIAQMCTEKWSYDFHVKSNALAYVGYAAGSVFVYAARLLTGREKYESSRNPLAYVAFLFAGVVSRLATWFQIDASGIKALWKKWAALPLWLSGRLIANAVRPIWVPYFGLAAAMLVASQIVQVFSPFLQSRGSNTYFDPDWNLVGASVTLGLAFLFAASWAAGRMTAEFDRHVRPLATGFGALFILFWQVESLITSAWFAGSGSTEYYFSLLQKLGEIIFMYSGYRLGYRREMRRRQTAS